MKEKIDFQRLEKNLFYGYGRTRTALADLPLDPSSFNPGGWRRDLDTSFPGQMVRLLHDRPPVDAYVFTLYSALPFADTLRGFYEAAGAELPYLSTLNVSQTDARRYYKKLPDFEWYHRQAINKLDPRLKDLGHITVIDEYVHSGSTISYAGQILKDAGVQLVSGIRGHWNIGRTIGDEYTDGFKPDEVDIANIAGCDPSMRVAFNGLGHRAFELIHHNS